MSELKIKTEERNDLVRQCQEVEARRVKEGRATYTEEETANLEKWMSRSKECETEINTIRRSQEIAALSYQEEAPQEKKYQAGGDLSKKEGWALRGWMLANNQAEHLITDRMKQAAYDLGVSLDRGQFIMRQQSIGTVGEGGYTRTPSAYAGIERMLKWHGGIASVCRTVPSANGNPGFIATVNDTATYAEDTSELTDVTNTALTFAKIDFQYHKLDSGVFPVSNELLTDSEEDISQLIEDLVGERFARKVNRHTTIGNLTNNKGFMVDATLGKTAADNTTLDGVSELLDLKFSIDRAYRDAPDVYWYMNDSTYLYLSKQTFEDGRPLFQDNFRGSNGPDLLHGKPIVICNEMDNIGSGAKPVAFGQAGKFVYRPAGLSFKVLNELYALSDAVGYIGFLRMSSRLLNPSAIKYLQMAAS